MPERSYSPVPTAAAKDIATPAVNLSFPKVEFSDAIGRALGDLGQATSVLGHYQGQVGSAIAHLGAEVGHAGDELWARASAIKTVENSTAAVEAETKFRIEADKMQDAFKSTQGNAASQGLDAHMKAMEDLRQKIKGTLPNPQATHMFDQDSMRALGSFIASASGHSATQSKASMIAAENARYKLALNDIYKDPDNPDNERRKQEALETYKRNVAPVIGEVGPALELKLKEMESEFDRMQITGIAKSDPNRATELLEKKRATMMAADIQQVEKGIEFGQLNSGPRLANKEINADLWEKKTDEEREKERDLRTRLQEADKWVDNYPGTVKNLEEFRQRVHQAVINGYTEEHKKRADETIRQLTILESALTGTRTQGVPAPTNMEMLRAQGDEVVAALAATGKKGMDMAYNAFKANIDRGTVKYNAVESLERFERLRAMASNGNTVKEFLNKTEDVNDPDLRLNESERKALVKLKADVLKNPQGDPRFTTYYGWLSVKYGAEMEQLGVFTRKKGSEDEYDAFRAGMMTTLEAWTQKNGRPPSRDEFMNQIAPELMRYKPSTGFLFWGQSEERPAWSPQTPIPEKWAEQHQAQIIAAGGQKLTDKELREDYIRLMFEESLKPKSGATTVAPAATQGRRTGRPQAQSPGQ